MELEDIFKAVEDITGKPMRLIALLQHPWNIFHAPLGENGAPWQSAAINLIYSGASVKKSGVICRFYPNLLNYTQTGEEKSADSCTPMKDAICQRKGWM